MPYVFSPPALPRGLRQNIRPSGYPGVVVHRSLRYAQNRFLYSFQEIAEREQAQVDLSAAIEQAEMLNQMLHTVLNTIPVRIFWKDRNLVYLGCNQLFAQDSGKSSPQVVVGATDYDMSWRESAELYRADDMLVMETNQPKLNYEEPQTRPDGTTIWLRTSKAPLRDVAGNVFGVLGTYEDITEEKRIAVNLAKATEAANHANKAKSQFLSSMSHELRTPLNAILGFGQLLEMDTESSTPSQRESINHILTAGHQLLALVNDILDLSRIDIGKMELNMQPLCIADLTLGCVDQVAVAIANQRNVTIENTITDTALLVQGDDLRLRQVLINLLSNAVKYNKENGRVTLSSKKEKEGRLRIEVHDTGPGIASDKLPLLFAPFERLDQKHGIISGVGIGLHITKQLVEAMHGTVGVECVPGKGCTFWFDLPLAEEADEPMAVPKKTNLQIPSEDSRFVVLYIEDNFANVQLVKGALKSRPGIELLVASSAEEGLTIAEEERPDLVLMDIKLPGIDGITATTILKGIDATRNIPVVALSADAMKEDIDRALSAGCSTYITKPIELRALYDVIDSMRLAK